MQQQMQNFDCAKAGNPQQCEARKMAYKECQGEAGPAFRQCVQQGASVRMQQGAQPGSL
ncbi:MAG: hypothetical protein MZW92_46035 [Comamonadaceae bacterium]|nr:hypothetical protein [Comamonadaceae bacterium]